MFDHVASDSDLRAYYVLPQGGYAARSYIANWFLACNNTSKINLGTGFLKQLALL